MNNLDALLKMSASELVDIAETFDNGDFWLAAGVFASATKKSYVYADMYKIANGGIS